MSTTTFSSGIQANLGLDFNHNHPSIAADTVSQYYFPTYVQTPQFSSHYHSHHVGGVAFPVAPLPFSQSLLPSPTMDLPSVLPILPTNDTTSTPSIYSTPSMYSTPPVYSTPPISSVPPMLSTSSVLLTPPTPSTLSSLSSPSSLSSLLSNSTSCSTPSKETIRKTRKYKARSRRKPAKEISSDGLQQQRDIANVRERKRTRSFNDAFTSLRRLIPTLPSDKLSKIQTIKIAASYIDYLREVLICNEPNPTENTENYLSPPSDEVTRCFNKWRMENE